jgi:hypothetical protein
MTYSPSLSQMADMFDEIETNEEVHRYAEQGVDISGAAAAHRAGDFNAPPFEKETNEEVHMNDSY